MTSLGGFKKKLKNPEFLLDVYFKHNFRFTGSCGIA